MASQHNGHRADRTDRDRAELDLFSERIEDPVAGEPHRDDDRQPAPTGHDRGEFEIDPRRQCQRALGQRQGRQQPGQRQPAAVQQERHRRAR